jgi:hypothetical protein
MALALVMIVGYEIAKPRICLKGLTAVGLMKSVIRRKNKYPWVVMREPE